jgi:AcrR family transcriptional regulator
VPSPRQEAKGARTRAAILATSARAFREQGFDAATLDGIGAELGLGRSAVLHHFSSKREILLELVRPLMADLDDLLDRVEATGRPSARRRRQFLVETVELLAKHRDVAALLTRDLTAHPHLGPDLQIRDRALRLVAIVVDINERHPLAPIRALAALGAILRPLAAPDEVVDFDDPLTRALLVDCASAVLRTPLPTR